MISRSVVLASLFFVAVLTYSAYVKRMQLDHSSSESGPDVETGAAAPSFSLPDLDGHPVSLDEAVAQHEVVIVNFWATWCGPCRIELPQFETIYADHHQDGLAIIAVNVGEDPDVVREFLSERPVSFTVLLDEDESVSVEYGVSAFPTTVVLDDEGRVAQTFVGLKTYLPYMVKQMLDERPTGD